MNFVSTSVEETIATVTLRRGKVNAINEPCAEELKATLEDLADDPGVKTLILTGEGSFFSFGLDIPEFVGYQKPDFLRFVEKFADLYTYLFLYKKPVVAALNGHTIAGGCMLATACDYRVMVSGKPRISLNEITFGSSLFPGSVDMLQYCVGTRNAELVAYTGAMYSAEEANKLGLVDRVTDPEQLREEVKAVAWMFAQRYGPAFESIKMLVRGETGERMRQRDLRYRDEMVNIWYSKETWEQLQQIKIRG